MTDRSLLSYGHDGARRRSLTARTIFSILAVIAGVAVIWAVTILWINELDRRQVENRAKQRIQNAIPAGTSVSQAYATLDQMNPHVERRAKTAFGDRRDLDYLYLIWNEGGKYLHTMETAVVLKDDVVTEVIVRSDSSNLGK